MAVDVGSAVGYLDLDISGFLAGLKSAQQEGNKASQNMATQIGGKITGMGKSISTVGSTLTKTMTLPVIGAGTAIIKLSSDFESAMSKVSAISGATGGDLDKLNAKAQEMGAKTKFSATESAEAFTYMAMAGWKTEDMLQGIDGIMSLAAADGLDLATTSDIVTDALTAFGLSAKDSGHFADVLAKASSNANTNVSMLGESFKYVAPVAGALGYTAEDTAIALGLMANAGIKGSQGGTALRGSLSRLIKPTDDAAALMEKYNIQLANSDGTMKPLIQVMKDLRTNMGNLSAEEQSFAAANIFGQEAMSGMLSIINASDEDFNKLTEQIYNADGAAQQMSETMLNNLSGQITILKSSLEGLALQFGEIILPYIKKFTEWIQNLILKLQELSPEQKDQIVKWAAFAAAIGPVLLVIGKLTSGVGSLITTFGKIPGAVTKVKGGFSALHTGFLNMKEGFALSKAGFSGLATQAGGLGTKLGVAAAGVTGPMLAIAAVVAVVIAAFVSLWKNNEEFRNKVTEIWNGIKETFNNFTQGIVDRLNSLGFNFSSITDVIKTIWEGFCNFMAPIFEYAFSNIAAVFEFITGQVLSVLDFWIALFKGDWQGCWDAIKSYFETTWNFIKNIFSNILNMMKGILDTVLGWFGTSWEECWNGVKSFFENIWNGIVSFFQGAWEAIKKVWEPVVPFFKMVWENIKNVYSVVKTYFEGMFRTAWEAIKFVWDAVTGYFSSIWETIKGIFSVVKNVLTGNWSEAWQGIKNIVNTWREYFSGIWKGIKGVFSSVGSWFSSTFSAAWQAVKNVFANWGSFFSGLWDKIKSTFSSLGTSIANAISGAVKSGINGVISMIENTIRGAVNIINGAINLINKIPGVSVGKITAPTLPRLAKGAVLKPNNPFLAVVGDQKRGVNVEAPLATIQEAVAQVIKSFAYKIIELQSIAVGLLASCEENLGYISYNGFVNPKPKVGKSGEPSDPDSRDGDTFIFNSPKPIDEIEAARQMKKAKRDLAEGF